MDVMVILRLKKGLQSVTQQLETTKEKHDRFDYLNGKFSYGKSVMKQCLNKKNVGKVFAISPKYFFKNSYKVLRIRLISHRKKDINVMRNRINKNGQ